MNEAAIVAARRDKTDISYDEIDFAIDRLTVGMQKQNQAMPPSRQRLVAYHEAGHAIMGALTDDYDMVTKVTIIPRSNGAGGFTLFIPSEERMESGLYSRKYLEAQLAVALGGRVAEEIVYGEDEVTTGASNDLQQVRNIARRMVAQWGFAKETLAPTAWETPDASQQMFGGAPTASDTTERAIDAEVQQIVQRAYTVCYNTLRANRELLDKVVYDLLDKETIDTADMTKLTDEYGVTLSQEEMLETLELPVAA